MEHPAPPAELERPAIWRTGLILLLLREGWLFRRYTFRQGHFGAHSAKPTTILYANCPIVEVLTKNAKPMDPSRIEMLIGRDATTGQFRASKAKEYPAELNRSFAEAFWTQMTQRCSPATSVAADAFAY